MILILSIIIAVIAFFVCWAVSDFFIAPRDKWTKSGFAIFLVKLGMSITASAYAFSVVYVFFGGK